MSLARRHEQIVEIVRREGFADIESMAALLGVTPQTIRRDVKELAAGGVVRRYHGGAALLTAAENIDYATRRILNLDAKRRIAALAAAQIPDNASLFINLGTTTEEAARALVRRRGLRVITNNLNVAAILGKNNDCEVIVAGGVVRSRDLGITGEATIECIRQFKVDYAVVGISGIEEDGTLRDFDFREVQVSKVIIQQARTVVLVADHSKFGRHALVRLGHLSQVDVMITDSPPPEAMDKVIDDAGVSVIAATSDGPAPSVDAESDEPFPART